MKTIEKLHEDAMAHVDEAQLAERRHDEKAARAAYATAFESEKKAALALEKDTKLEPSRSILFRSAAWLAIRSERFEEAKRMAILGLSGDPPPENSAELWHVLSEAKLGDHLSLKGIRLTKTEFQLSLDGAEVADGIAPASEVIDRIEKVRKLVRRTAERCMQEPYNETGGRPSKKLLEDVDVFMSVGRTGSYALTCRVGSPQLSLPGFEKKEGPEVIVDEIVDCLDLYAKGDEKALESHINDEAYYRNFTGLAQQLQPDGNRLNLVGITVWRNGAERRVALRPRPRPKTAKPFDTAPSKRKHAEPEVFTIVGRMLYADSRSHQHNQIKLVEEKDGGVEHTVIVPKGMMADVVRPLFEEKVRAEATRQGKALLLVRVERCSE